MSNSFTTIDQHERSHGKMRSAPNKYFLCFGGAEKRRKGRQRNGTAGAFSKGSALLTSITENRCFPVLKSRVAKPESDLKIPPISGGSLPRALSDFTPCIPRYTVTDSLTLLPVELAGLSHRLPVYPYPV